MKSLKGVLVYVQLKEPVDCFEKQRGQEWKASVVVDEDTADTWNDMYPKQAATVVKTSEFKQKYKIDPIFPDEKKHFVITLRKNTKLADGSKVPELYQPKVFLKTENGLQDITKEKLVGNGSIGAISWDHFDSKYGPVARLKNVLVNSLVEYEEGENPSYKPGAEFEEEDAAVSAPVTATTTPKQTNKTQQKQSSKTEVEDDDSPF